MNGNPNKEQKDWHNWLRDRGCFICFAYPSIHHVKGSKLKLKGIIKPGEWFCLPLCYLHHQGRLGVHTDKRRFRALFGTEKEIFSVLVDQYEVEMGEDLMDDKTYNAIMDRA